MRAGAGQAVDDRPVGAEHIVRRAPGLPWSASFAVVLARTGRPRRRRHDRRCPRPSAGRSSIYRRPPTPGQPPTPRSNAPATGRGAASAGPEQRTQPGEGAAHVGAGGAPGQVAAGGVEDEVDLLASGRGSRGSHGACRWCRAAPALPGDHEEHPAVGRGDQQRVAAGQEARSTPRGRPGWGRAGRARWVVELADLVGPHAGGVDDDPAAISKASPVSASRAPTPLTRPRRGAGR
jgi:hypothetical protein